MQHIDRHICRGLLTKEKAIQELGITRHQLDYRISVGDIPAPAMSGGKRRKYYKLEQLEEINRTLQQIAKEGK